MNQSNLTRPQISESFPLGAALTITGGFLDAYSYLTRGSVFATAQTGNIVLLGLRLVKGEWSMVLHYLIPILAFAAGVLAADFFKYRFRGLATVHWRQISVLAELLVLMGVAFLPHSLDNIANICVAFICAVQVESFRKVNGNAFATTMCTGNLRSGTEHLFHFLRTGDRDHLHRMTQYYVIILFFILGAVLGSICCSAMGRLAALVAALPLVVALLMVVYQEDQNITQA